MRRNRSFLFVVLATISAVGVFALAQQPRPTPIVGFPPVLEKLELTGDQRKQIESIVSQRDALFLASWQEFTNCYQKTLKAEAILLAAIENGFTDEQRQQALKERGQAIAANAAPAPATKSDAKNPATSTTTEKAPAGVLLKPEQVAAASKLQEKYHVHLGPMTSDLQNCHNRMLAIEIEKFVEIQKVLNPEQLTKLSQLLQSGEAANIAGLAPAKGK